MLDAPSSRAGTDTGELRALGRRLADFRTGPMRPGYGLPPAEEQLLDAVLAGQPCIIGETRPEAATEENSVRAGFIRFLALGGDDDVPIEQCGVHLQGAYIAGPLELDYLRCANPLRLVHCVFEDRIAGRGGRFAALSLDGSKCRDVVFDDAEFAASVSMAKDFYCEGTVRLTGAKIGGDLDFEKAHLVNPNADVLACRRLRVERSVFLSSGFVAEGGVRFTGAEIGGDLGCFGGRFVQRRAARKADPGDRPRADYALSLTNANIRAVLWLGPWTEPYDKQALIEGSLNLQGAHASTLADHEESWPVASITTADGERLPCVIALDGFTYERLAPGAPFQARKRRNWLMRQLPRRGTGAFRPQPFEQLIAVLRNMGFEQDARRIGLMKEQELQTLRLRRASFWVRPFVGFIGILWGGFCGYGYRPHRLAVTLFALWAMSAAFFYAAEKAGGFAPRDAEIWTNEKIIEACAGSDWTVCPEVATLIPFNAVTYAADTLLPIIDLQQRSTWAPMLKSLTIDFPYLGVRTMPPGALYVVIWIVNILGAVGAILFGVILSGLVRRD